MVEALLVKEHLSPLFRSEISYDVSHGTKAYYLGILTCVPISDGKFEVQACLFC